MADKFSSENVPFAAALADRAQQSTLAALAADGGVSLLAQGTDLSDADVTVNPGTDAVSVYTMPAGTLTTGHVIALGVTGSLTAGVSTVWIQCRDVSTNTLTIRNSGTNGTSIPDVVIPASRGKPMLVGSTYDGVDWVPHTMVFVT